ncbi:MAG: hypothetical protein M3P08_16755 [Thermoproteota archaeon]|nr:hypothetical protein [Thermoproteota archaeon]
MALYFTENNPGFISGHIRARGRKNGRYPYKYPEMIDRLFGKEDNTIEVCSGTIREYHHSSSFAVDINPETNPEHVGDGQTLSSIANNTFNC